MVPHPAKYLIRAEDGVFKVYSDADERLYRSRSRMGNGRTLLAASANR